MREKEKCEERDKKKGRKRGREEEEKRGRITRSDEIEKKRWDDGRQGVRHVLVSVSE